MKRNNRYIVIILIFLGFNILGSFQCMCNHLKEDEEIDLENEPKKDPIDKKAWEEANNRLYEKEAKEALEKEGRRQEFFQKMKKSKQERRDAFLKNRLPIRQAFKKNFETNPSQSRDVFIAEDSKNSINNSRFGVSWFRNKLSYNTSRGLDEEQKKYLRAFVRKIDYWSRKLEKERTSIADWINHLYPEAAKAGIHTPETLHSMGVQLQDVEEQLKDLKQQRSELAQMAYEQGENIEDYETKPDPEETLEESEASKALFLAISDPNDAIELVTALEQKMQQMIDQYAPVPTTRSTLRRYTLDKSEIVEKQAKELAMQAYELLSILKERESYIEKAYFFTDISDYIERSTEEGVKKLKLIQAAIDQLEEIYELFKARLHVVGYSPDIDFHQHLTKSYINALVNALVDQMVPGSELAKGKTLPTTAESWADLALSNGLDILQKTDTNKFEDVKGIWLLIKPIGSHRYNMLKERIIEVYRQRKK